MAEKIAHHQRIAALQRVEHHPTLEIHGPDMIGVGRFRQRGARHFIQSGFAPWFLTGPVPVQNLCNRAARRQRFDAVLSAQNILELPRSPRAIALPHPQDQLFELHVRAI